MELVHRRRAISTTYMPSDVQDFGCDFFVCSAYKFFGPHQGILWGRREVFSRAIAALQSAASPDELPWCFETRARKATRAWPVRLRQLTISPGSVRRWLVFRARRRDNSCELQGLELLFDYERQLAEQLIAGLQEHFRRTRILGISDPDASRQARADGVIHARTARAVRNRQSCLAERNIFAWSGHNYALEVAKALLNINDSGGAVRIGAGALQHAGRD